MSLLNTYIINTDRFNAVKQVASRVFQSEASHVEAVEGSRVDGIDLFVQSYPCGSERDVECQADLKKTCKK